MTQPTINFEDGTFPDAEVSEIDRLTAAIRHHAAAINNLAVEIELARKAGSLQPPAERYTAASDPRIERVQPCSADAEEFWADFGVDIHRVHAAVAGVAGQAVAVEIKKALEDVPDGWVAVLDPPVYMNEETASRSGIQVDRELWVRKVRRTVGSDFYGWCFLEAGEPHEEITWGANTDQVRALGLRYDDFSAPEQ